MFKADHEPLTSFQDALRFLSLDGERHHVMIKYKLETPKHIQYIIPMVGELIKGFEIETNGKMKFVEFRLESVDKRITLARWINPTNQIFNIMENQDFLPTIIFKNHSFVLDIEFESEGSFDPIINVIGSVINNKHRSTVYPYLNPIPSEEAEFHGTNWALVHNLMGWGLRNGQTFYSLS